VAPPPVICAFVPGLDGSTVCCFGSRRPRSFFDGNSVDMAAAQRASRHFGTGVQALKSSTM
jgi:hypothetical protein